MDIKKRGIYVSYFWKYASFEQIEDMLDLSIDSIVDYILIIGEEKYLEHKNELRKSILDKVKLHSATQI